jgi:ribosomal protein L7/L12
LGKRTENFKKAIEYLTGPGLDLKAVIIEIAKTNPAVFCRAVERAKYPAAKWRRQAEALVLAGKKINAIKLCRENTGLGLKEAKEMIDFFEQYREWRVA